MASRLHLADVDWRAPAARPWQWLTVLAGLTLAVTFFMDLTGFRIGFSARPVGSIPQSPFYFWIGLLDGQFRFGPDGRTAAFYTSFLFAMAGCRTCGGRRWPCTVHRACEGWTVSGEAFSFVGRVSASSIMTALLWLKICGQSSRWVS